MSAIIPYRYIFNHKITFILSEPSLPFFFQCAKSLFFEVYYIFIISTRPMRRIIFKSLFGEPIEKLKDLLVYSCINPICKLGTIYLFIVERVKLF